MAWIDDKYLKAQNAQKIFFSEELTSFQKANIIDQFMDYKYNVQYNQYSNRPFWCSINGLSSCSRILLIKELTRVNLQFGNDDQEIVFKFGRERFNLCLTPRTVKRGNLFVSDMGSHYNYEGNGTYKDIKYIMKDIFSRIPPARAAYLMRQSRTNGDPIYVSSLCPDEQEFDDVSYLNRFVFLWDCEVARYLQTPIQTQMPGRDQQERRYHELPIAIAIACIQQSLIKQNTVDLDLYLDRRSDFHFFSGQPHHREKAIKEILSQRRENSVNNWLQLLKNQFGNSLTFLEI